MTSWLQQQALSILDESRVNVKVSNHFKLHSLCDERDKNYVDMGENAKYTAVDVRFVKDKFPLILSWTEEQSEWKSINKRSFEAMRRRYGLVPKCISYETGSVLIGRSHAVSNMQLL